MAMTREMSRRQESFMVGKRICRRSGKELPTELPRVKIMTIGGEVCERTRHNSDRRS